MVSFCNDTMKSNGNPINVVKHSHGWSIKLLQSNLGSFTADQRSQTLISLQSSRSHGKEAPPHLALRGRFPSYLINWHNSNQSKSLCREKSDYLFNTTCRYMTTQACLLVYNYFTNLLPNTSQDNSGDDVECLCTFVYMTVIFSDRWL